MDRRMVFVAVLGAFCAVLLVTVASSGTVRYAERAPTVSFDRMEQPVLELAPATVPEPREEPEDAPPPEWPGFVTTIFKILLVAGLVLLAIWGWRNRPRLTWRRRDRARSDDVDVLADIAASVAADAEVQRRTLLSGEPRNAIVECWLRLESLVVEAGITRRDSDTSTEIVERVLVDSSVDAVAIRDLSSLYREARFSSHPIDEDARSAAIVALDAVHAGLRGTSPVDAVGAVAGEAVGEDDGS